MIKTKSRLADFALIGLILMTAWIACYGDSAEAATLKAKVINYSVKLEHVPAGDVQGHVVGLNTREGKVVCEDGQTADYAMASIFDFTVGKGGISNGYTRMTFKDGSFIMFKWKTDVGIGRDKLPTSKGTGIITSGGGRYKGIKGTVSFAGKRTKPTSEDPKREMAIDAVIEYTLNRPE